MKKGFILFYFLLLIPIISTTLIIKINEIKQLKKILSKQSYIIKNNIILNDVKRIVRNNFKLLKKKDYDINKITGIPFVISGGPEELEFTIKEKNYTFYIPDKTSLEKTRLYLDKLGMHFHIKNIDLLNNNIISNILSPEFNKNTLYKTIKKYQEDNNDEYADNLLSNLDNLFQFDNNKEKNSFYKTDNLYLSILMSETIKNIIDYKKLKKSTLFRTLDKRKIFYLKKQNIYIRERPNKKYIIFIIIKYNKYKTLNELVFDFKEGKFIETDTDTKFRYY